MKGNRRYIRIRKTVGTGPKTCAVALTAALLCCLAACSDADDDGYAYPSLLTELAELYTDSEGEGVLFTTDDGQTYAIRTPIQGLQAEAAYRIVCGYEPTQEKNGPYSIAIVYSVENVCLLHPADQTDTAPDDPTALTAIWRGGGYLNLQLAPKTQGGKHQWGYRRDSVTDRRNGKTLHLSLCHRQGEDPPAYSTTVYASLPLDELSLQEGDSISFTVLTFDGKQVWNMAY